MGDRQGAVYVAGLAQFRRDLRRLEDGKALAAEFRAAERRIAQRVAQAASAEARSMDAPAAHFAGNITGRVTRYGAEVGVPRKAFAAFAGAKKKTGWNAYSYLRKKAKHHTSVRAGGAPGRKAGNAVRYRRGETPNQLPWIGNDWVVGEAGQGPYAINDAVDHMKPQIIEWYGDAIMAAARSTFPD